VASLLSPDMVPFVIAGGSALVVMLLGWAFSGREDGPNTKVIEKRLKRSDEMVSSGSRAPKGRAGVRRDMVLSDNPTIDAFLRRVLPNPARLRARLQRTGKAITISEFLLVVIATMMGLAIILRLSTPLDVLVCILLGILVGLVLPLKVISVMGNRRVAKFMKIFPDGIDLIVRGLKSGLPFLESVNAVGREFPDPVGIEFRRISDSVKLGQSVESAMWEVADRIDSPEFKFMIVALSIQRETGGNLGETLGNLSELLRRRRGLQLKIRALSSEARASAYIIGALPFIMAALINIVNPSYGGMLYKDPRGQVMAMKGMAWMFIGYYIMYRLVNFDY
jgi:tight adherence protein B